VIEKEFLNFIITSLEVISAINATFDRIQNSEGRLDKMIGLLVEVYAECTLV